jgi:DMSO reductase anchor subunit
MSMENLERFFYESKPFLCLGLGAYALLSSEPSRIALVCGLVLLFAGTLILRGRFKNRRGSPLEDIWYEAQPFLYLGIVGYVLLFQRASKIAAGSALLLLFCASMILRWRFKNRQN